MFRRIEVFAVLTDWYLSVEQVAVCEEGGAETQTGDRDLAGAGDILRDCKAERRFEGSEGLRMVRPLPGPQLEILVPDQATQLKC